MRYVNKLRKLLLQGTPEDRINATSWYPQALELAEKLSVASGWSIPTSAGVIAALSPRCRWERNQRAALEYANGRKISGMLGNSYASADRVIAHGLADLRGIKCRAFASAILGDWRTVVIDSHMLHAVGEANDTPNKSQRLNICDAVYRIASETKDTLRLSPRDMQAYIWLIQIRQPRGAYNNGDF